MNGGTWLRVPVATAVVDAHVGCPVGKVIDVVVVAVAVVVTAMV